MKNHYRFVVAPEFCTREMFFSSLKNRLLAHPSVSDVNPIEGAYVPLIELVFEGVSIDLLFARLPNDTVPDDYDACLDDNYILKADPVTTSALNGPRVTEIISRLMFRGTPRYDNFLAVLRCVRKWAKRRGLYGNKQGYLGGINCNILTAFICQLYLNANPSTLLSKFFHV